MIKKKVIAIVAALSLSLVAFASFGSFSDGTDSYVSRELVSLYSAYLNTDEGHDEKSAVWKDTVSASVINVENSGKNYFTEDAYHVNSAQFDFPSELLSLVNSEEYTVELKMSGFGNIGSSFATLVNSSGNDNFALFHRVSGDYLEFKCGSNSRPKVTGGKSLLSGTYTLTVTFRLGGNIRMYVNGWLVDEKPAVSKTGAAGRLFFGHAETGKRFEADFHMFRFYAAELTEDEVAQNAKADGTFDYDRKKEIDEFAVLQPKTNIIGDIALAERIENQEQLKKYNAEQAFLPACFIVYLSADGKLTDRNFKNPYGDIKDAFDCAFARMIPVFAPENESAAEKLVGYMDENGKIDAAVISADPGLVGYARKKGTYLRGIIDYTSSLDGTIPDKEKMLDIRRECVLSMAKIALLPSSAATYETVSYLNSRQITVWVETADSADGALSAALCGAYGIVSTGAEKTYGIIQKYIPENTLTRPAAIIGHRGLPSSQPENTLESAIAAYNAGADIIELDIYITKDKEIVINHDSSTTLYNKKISVEGSTLAELKELDYNGCKIPTLKEFFEEFKGKDVMLFIEIKSSKTIISSELKKLVDEYGMYGQCTVIAYASTGQLSYMKKFYPEMPVSMLDGGYTKGTMATILKNVGKYNTTYSPDKSGCDGKFVRYMLMRGLTDWPYTFASLGEEMTYIYYGHSGITTNVADQTAKMPEKLVVSYSDDTGTFSASVYDKAGTGKTVSPEYVAVSGKDILVARDGKVTFTEKGNASIFAVYKTVFGGLGYSLVSDIISLSSENEGNATVLPTDDPDEEKTPTDTPSLLPTPSVTEGNDDESGSNVPVLPIIAAAVILSASLIAVFLIVRSKRRKS